MRTLNAKFPSVIDGANPVPPKPRRKNPLADFEGRKDVRAVFAKVQKSDAFSLSAAHKAFAGIVHKKK